VISGLNITGSVIIKAPNVTIENCSITSSDYNGVNIYEGVTGTVVQNCTINGTGAGPGGSNGIGGSGTFLNNNIFGFENGINIEGSNNVIKGNYIHDLNDSDGSAGHYDGIQVDGGFNNVDIENNTVIGRDTSCIFICNDFGPMDNIVVNHNLLLGENDAASTVYVIEKPNNPAQITNVQVTNNVLGKGYWYWAYIASTSPVWTNNIDYATGKVVSLDNTLSTAPAGSPAPTGLNAPVISSFSPDTGASDGITSANKLDVKGTADPNSTITVYDGGTKLGTTTASSTGSWDYITAVLTDAKHVLTATETNTSGQTSAASAALTVTVDTHVPAAPVLVSDPLVNTNHVQLSGTAEANSTITVYDGTTVVGTGTTSSTGSWSLTTSALSSGTQALTATATDVAGTVGAMSQALDPVIPTGAPAAPPPPTTPTGSTGLSGVVHVGNNYFLDVGSISGPELKYHGAAVTTGEFQDWTPIGAVQVAGGGYDVAWKNSSGQFTFWATDSQGNFQSYPTHGVALAGNSTTVESYETIFHQDLNGDGVIGIPGATPTPTPSPAPTSTPPASAVNFTSLTENSSDVVTIKGTADAFSQVKLYDGATSLGTVTTGSTGTWSYTTSSAVSDTLHTFTAQEVNNTGHVVATSSGSAIMAASNTGTMTGTGGNDFFYSSSSNLSDTFVFSSSFGNSTIQGFSAGSGSGHDIVQFSKSVFDSFATVLSHASQVGHDVVISSGSETLKLLNTNLSALNSQDFHFA
jgi:hypothetical protein